MLCPLCARALAPVERQGVEIDLCTSCGGMWLDSGELSELIRREALASIAAGQTALSESRRDREYDRPVDGSEVNHFALSRGARQTSRR